ncbi:MAG: nitrilase-related carbon-nitrogen hydrolase [Candidatus Cloacimonadota bacterium]|nr:nitrilase-related carbon-nitrogen hydrolase [Candidatus Cloacimonadota bacterium]
MEFKVGVCQFKPELMQTEKNLKKMESLIESVSADLIVLPELAASGYLFNSEEEVQIIAEDPENGPTATLFRKLAKQNNISYVIGFAEKATNGIYNSAMLVNPDSSIHIYRKTHLFFEEKKWFKAGDTGFNVFRAKNNVKVGLMICFDWIFPESTRSLALAGAQIIAHSANLVLPWCQQAMLTRSLENGVFSATSNRTGTDKNGGKKLHFTGMSQIVDTKGQIIHRMDKVEESVFITEIDPLKSEDKDITEFNNLFFDRRTELYRS